MKTKGHLAAAVAGILAVSAATAQTVTSEAGGLKGSRGGDLTVYKGVPYAAAPLGALRWRPPQPAAPWKGTRKAEAFAPACMQTGVSMPGETPPAVSEDCLYLNIWAPRAAKGLPVMVWIHGGGWPNGSAAMPLYWGDRLARRGVIVVTIAYRLGPFGFLAHPELSAESAHRSSGNYGLMNQIAALKWVQHNITAFGGDPARVTIAGQSAGAMSVSLLMSSPLAKGLFQRAIGESGGVFEPFELAPGYMLANAEHDGEAYAASLGARTLAQLRALPAGELLKGKANSISHPVLEPFVLPRSPYDVFAAGAESDVPLLIGSNEDEARSLADLKSVTAANFTAELEKSWGKLPPPVVAAYPYTDDAQAKTARADLERDLRFGWDMWAWARLQAASAKSEVYYYHFTREPPFPRGSIYQGWGAGHYTELWYVFDHLDQEKWPWTPADRKLADAMAGYWTNFAKSGNPNGAGLASWPRFETRTAQVQMLGDPIATGDVAHLKTLQVFDAVYAQVRGKPFGKPPSP
jgi:para-nitrobenzyl esterase